MIRFAKIVMKGAFPWVLMLPALAGRRPSFFTALIRVIRGQILRFYCRCFLCLLWRAR